MAGGNGFMTRSSAVIKKFHIIFVALFLIVFLYDAIINVDGYKPSVIEQYISKANLAMGFILWVSMLVDYMMKVNSSNAFPNKVLWGIIVFFGYVLGAFIYFIVIYLKKE